ncbi:MAG TPA: dinitrogenase iron-molybdenum cofactor biosynthesis protein [Bacteroidetes bacterium]|nr:dinitrogenase iron-molybdenum cofactor biosynthesis protein [Bacteroidota bacterium]
MKIAIATVDGETVSQHFGRSRYYKIYTIEGNDPAGMEMRERGTGHFAQGKNPDHHAHHEYTHPRGQGHGYGREADSKHASMAREIGDCDVLVAGGMGMGAYESFRNAGLEVILTDLQDINDVVNAYVKGDLKNLAGERTD